MITDEEIQTIFNWADKNKIVGKRWKNQKWGINLSGDEINSVKRGIPRDKDTLLQMTHLNLSKFKLSDIPNELYKLTKLQYLNISDNQILGLSKDIGNLVNLEYLNVSWNFNWNDNENIFLIPKEIKNLKKLKYLNLSSLELENIPIEIWSLEKLETLKLGSDDYLINITKEIGKLRNLKYLELSFLNNYELPKEIGELSKLEYLIISNSDNLKKIPSEIGDLQALTHLELDLNIKKLPKEIGKLSKLSYLKINCIRLEIIPNEIEELKNLTYLHLYYLDIKELPKKIGKLLKLEHLIIDDCYKLELIPSEIGELKNLTQLKLNNSNIKALPKEIGKLNKLEYLDISQNENLEFLPKEIGNLTQLISLNLRNLNLKQLPDELSNLKNLKFLNGEPYVILNKTTKNQTIKNKKMIKRFLFSLEEKGNLTFPHKNLLLKGVPGTGKSRAIENIINNKLNLKDYKENILRINIHSASSNADLMQGIGISSKDGQIEYKEKQGLILNLIERATFNPNQPFVLILEEIQENSLNELIGDLIYLIEEDKRAKDIVADDEEYEYQELVEKIIADNPQTAYVEIPYLVNDSTEYRKMIMPNNLYIFCTSNYRDDKKVIEDNLLRRFEVLEIYPKDSVVNDYCKEFFSQLNKNILVVMKDEIHPDRFLIGHSNWLKVDNDEKFYRAFLKVVVEFKDIKEVEFSDFKSIIEPIVLPKDIRFNLNSYKELIEDIQSKEKAGYDFLD